MDENYTGFAAFYDEFMDDIPYDDWSEYIVGLLKERGIDEGLVCELGCGTCEITKRLQAAGYDMIGIDKSEDMLALAYEEMTKNTDSVSFPYMNRILAEWQRAGIRTPEAAAEREKKFTEEKEKKAAQRAKASPYAVRTAGEQPAQPASYDIDKAIDKMKTTVPTLKKKEKR